MPPMDNTSSTSTEIQHAPPQGRCKINELPPEILSRILVLTVKSVWQEGLRAALAPTASKMGVFPGHRSRVVDEIVFVDDKGGFADTRQPFKARQSDADLTSYLTSCLNGDVTVTYPNPFLDTCEYWHETVLSTPELWSYITISDKTPTTEIADRLLRSGSFQLSLRIVIFMEDPVMDHLRILEDTMKLLLQHVGRWQRFHILSETQIPTQHISKLMEELDVKSIATIQNLRLHTFRRSKPDNYPVILPTDSHWRPFRIFCTFVRFLLDASVYLGRSPHGGQNSSLELLREDSSQLQVLELWNGDISRKEYIAVLRATPRLRTLKLINISIRSAPLAADSGPDTPSTVVLTELQELTLHRLRSDFRGVWNYLCAPNLESLSCDTPKLLLAFSAGNTSISLQRLLKLSLQADGLRDKVQISKLYSMTSGVVNLHLNGKALVEPLLQSVFATDTGTTLKMRSPLPHLSVITLTNVDGNSILQLVKGRCKMGVPVDTVQIDRTDIDSGLVTSEHWESLRHLVTNLRWVGLDGGET